MCEFCETCSNPVPVSLFDTPEFLTYSSHCIAIVSVPIHIFGIYCVIFKTPSTVKNVRSAMLLSCCCAFLLDIFLTVLSIPFMLYPAVAGFPLGLLNYVGVSVKVQTIMGIFVVGATFNSITCLIQNRYCQVVDRSEQCSRIFQYFTCTANFLASCAVCCIAYYLIPEQSSSKNHIFSDILPCLPQYIYDSPVFVATRDSISSTLCFGVPVIGVAVQLGYLTSSSIYHLYFKYDTNWSIGTRRLQKKFFIAVMLQIGVPIIALFFPIAFIGYSLTFGYYNQAFNNFSMLFLCSHGTLETLSMIIIHPPYRATLICDTTAKNEKLFQIMRRKQDNSVVFDVGLVELADIVFLPSLCNSTATFPVIATSFLITHPIYLRIHNNRMCQGIVDQSFFGSPDFLKHAAHFLSFITVPIHIFGFYCIIYKTPVKVKSVKPALFLSCFCAFVFDIQLTLLSVPFLLTPALALSPLGLLNHIGVSSEQQTVISLSVASATFCSIIALMQNRYSQISGKSPQYSTYSQIVIFLANFIAINIINIIGFLHAPEQTSARTFVFNQILPCLPEYIYDSPVFVMAISTDGVKIIFAIEVVIALGEIFTLVFLTNYYLNFKKSTTLSQNTRKLQKTLFFAVCLQVSVPLTALFIPGIYVSYSFYANYYNQALNNIVVCFVFLHGTLETISMVVIHQPYRRVLFRNKNKPNTIFRTRSMLECPEPDRIVFRI